LLFQDEGRFGRLSDVRRCWAPPGVRPHVAQAHVREYINALVAVSPFDGQLATLLAHDLDAGVMSAFLALTAARFPDDTCLMVVDGAGYHIAGDLVVPPSMRLTFLPPYSPELNPVESLWDYVRDHYTGNRLFASLRSVERQLCTAFGELRDDPMTVQSMTLFNWIERLEPILYD
jgi:hypothetical protein